MSAATQHHGHDRRAHREHPAAASVLLIVGLITSIAAMWIGLTCEWSPADVTFDVLSVGAVTSIGIAGLLSRD